LASGDRNDAVVILCPEHANLISDQGWTRSDIQNYLFERAVRSVADLRRGGMWRMKDWTGALYERSSYETALVPFVRRAEDILLPVAGGHGKHSVVIPSFGVSHAQSRVIDCSDQIDQAA